MEEKMIYRDKTELIRKGLFAVQNDVGLGRSEDVYHRAFCLWLDEAKIPFFSKRAHHIMLDDQIAHTLFPDIVVWDCITIELKSYPRRLRDEDRVQIFNYLKRRRDKLGLLVNMGLERVHVERIVYDEPQNSVVENWEDWSGLISGKPREIGRSIRDAVLNIYQSHGTGYGTEVTEKLIASALRNATLSYSVNPQGSSNYQGVDLGNSLLDCLVIEKEFLLVFTSLFDANVFNIHRARSFLKSLDLPYGIAVNFGKQNYEINALINIPSSIRGTPLASVGHSS
jgi:GxxExxY protein